MIYTPMTIKALNLAYNAHQGQNDLSGIPYIFHPYHLAEQMNDEVTTCVALLHDVVEDTDVTLDRLEQEFPSEVTEAVRLLTHQKGTSYFDYIHTLKANPIARAVKLRDLAHNSDESRLCASPDFPAETLARWREKYARAREILLVEER